MGLQMRNIFIGLLASSLLIAGTVAAQSQARRAQGMSYCPEGTCGFNNTKRVPDLSQCSPKNCTGPKGSSQKSAK
jgi:hypothetical protein